MISQEPIELRVGMGFEIIPNRVGPARKEVRDPQLTSLWIHGWGWLLGGARPSTISYEGVIVLDQCQSGNEGMRLDEEFRQLVRGYNYFNRGQALFPTQGDTR